MFVQFVLGSILVTITVFVHAIILDKLIKYIDHHSHAWRMRFVRHWKIVLITITVMGVMAANMLEIWIWAVAYYVIQAQGINDFETALYFSTSAFTTVGFGDIYLQADWRLMSSFESANGMILFGWSTAFIFDVVSKLYRDEKFKDK